MTKMMVFAIGLIVLTSAANAQFKSQPNGESKISDNLMQSSSSLFGWFNPEKFHMRHSLSFSYQTIGSQGLSLGTYTNSMMYEVADNLNARADVSLSYSPYNSFAQHGKSDLSNIYLSRAQVDYKPWENFTVQLQYRNIPSANRYYSPFYSPWYREDGF
ncbi:MAG: hypothetical protein ACKVRP_12790 [Bacteroidota bacterium]